MYTYIDTYIRAYMLMQIVSLAWPDHNIASFVWGLRHRTKQVILRSGYARLADSGNEGIGNRLYIYGPGHFPPYFAGLKNKDKRKRLTRETLCIVPLQLFKSRNKMIKKNSLTTQTGLTICVCRLISQSLTPNHMTKLFQDITKLFKCCIVLR